MRTLVTSVFFFLASQVVATRTATIEGFVVRAANGEPVPFAGVELARTDSPASATYIASTNAEGKFALMDVVPGEYRLAATRMGYVRSEYGQRGPNSKGLILHVAAGQEQKDLRIALTETAAAYGRVYDKSGSPLPNVQVQALKFIYRNGRRVFSTVKAVVTNDLGEYRLFWLPAGQYYISATPLPGSMPDTMAASLGGNGVSLRAMPPAAGALIVLPDDPPSTPFYYPGTLDPKAAQSIELRPADNRGGMDIRIDDFRVRRVRGFVTNLPAGGAFTQIRLVSRDEVLGGFPDGSLPATSPNGPNGAFELLNVRPGSYYVTATTRYRTDQGTPLSGRIPIDVFDTDIDGISISLEPTVNILVQVSIEDQPSDSPDIRRLRLTLDTGQVAEPSPQQPGIFTFTGVGIAEQRISVASLPENAYVKSMRAGLTDILNEGLNVENRPDGFPPIQIVIGTNAGTLDGTVLNDERAGFSNATVAVVPDPSRRQRWDLYKNAATDATGAFRISGLAPGDYKVFAWEDVEAGAWQDPDFIRSYEDGGVSVVIVEGRKETVQLRAIGAQQFSGR